MQGRLNSQASILDRLLDDEPNVSREPVQHRLLDIRQIKARVVRDLENLLNTRRQIISVPASYREVNNSLFAYGLGDFTSENPKSPSVRQQLRQDIEKTILRFEPRLKNVNVRLEDDPEKGRNLRFRISGLLVIEPETEPVSFDTYFDSNRGEYVIQK
ncbi:Type VI secretion system lysozyme-related protein [uncultured Desulfobacterium sp.]|uniref:Type VI secretion system lysozyme-related protein n=1 Tax=uncultured Desulfobacterium sp. TaxID=201089 RepID=A0A445MTN3_9BACT|nr:Type VI secretion system lysozyme-related protein [uncultured Desulfobacterium sp.]